MDPDGTGKIMLICGGSVGGEVVEQGRGMVCPKGNLG
jgi:hypothetical protein